MATARKSGASRPKPKPVKSAKVAVAKPAGKPAKPSPPKAVAKAAPSKTSAAKPAPAKSAAAARPVVGKPAVKGTKPAAPAKAAPAKAAPAKVAAHAKKPVPAAAPAKGKVIGKPAVAGKPGAKPAAIARDSKGRPIPAPAALKRTGKPIIRVVSHDPVASARPIGALPPEAVARAVKGHGPIPTRPVKPVRPTRDTKHPSGAEGVSEKDFKEFEQRLIAERQKIMKDMGYLENNVLKVNQRDSAGDLSGYSFHMADVGTDAYEREKAFLFASSEGRLLMDIDDALRKLYRGEYGRCEICEQPITRARLEAMPAARLCLSCKEKQERESRGAQ